MASRNLSMSSDLLDNRLARFMFALILTLVGCVPASSIEPVVQIDLTNLQPLPTPILQEAPLRVAIAAVISPQGTVESYSDLIKYLGEQTNRPIELVQRRTYMEVNDLIEAGEVDLAFVCTSAYIVGSESFGMELLAAPQVEGKTSYHSFLIVPIASQAQSMADLRGKVFAFTDPISLTGRAYPTALLRELGSTPEEFFSRTFFTYSHDEAIYAVANGLADGAAVDSLVYDYALARDPSLMQKVRIIHRSPPFGIPPVVVNPALRPQIKAELQNILLEMANNPEGIIALKKIGVEKFVQIEDTAYADVRALMNTIGIP